RRSSSPGTSGAPCPPRSSRPCSPTRRRTCTSAMPPCGTSAPGIQHACPNVPACVAGPPPASCCRPNSPATTTPPPRWAPPLCTVPCALSARSPPPGSSASAQRGCAPCTASTPKRRRSPTPPRRYSTSCRVRGVKRRAVVLASGALAISVLPAMAANLLGGAALYEDIHREFPGNGTAVLAAALRGAVDLASVVSLGA